MAQKKIWGPNDISAISQEMVRQNRGFAHGYSDSAIMSAMSGKEKMFENKDISFVANDIIATLSGGMGGY